MLSRRLFRPLALFDPFRSADDEMIDFVQELGRPIRLEGLDENPESFEMRINLGKFPKDKAQITYDEDSRMLEVKGEHEATKEEQKDGKAWSHQYSSFSRSVMLPESAQADAVKANMVGNTLKLTIPKTKEAIEAAKAAAQQQIAEPVQSRVKKIEIQ